MTLLELLLVLAVLAVAAAVVSLSFRPPLDISEPRPLWVRVSELRAKAVRDGQPTTAILSDLGATSAITAYPDGRVIDDPTSSIDVLTGRPRGQP